MIPNPCLADLHSVNSVLALLSVVAGGTGLFAVLRGEGRIAAGFVLIHSVKSRGRC